MIGEYFQGLIYIHVDNNLYEEFCRGNRVIEIS